MTTLNPDSDYLVVINTFDVEPDKAEELLAALSRATEYVRTVPGFVSANFQMSVDRRHVTNYAQWRSQADFDAFMANPASREQIGASASSATAVKPIFYSLRKTYEPAY